MDGSVTARELLVVIKAQYDKFVKANRDAKTSFSDLTAGIERNKGQIIKVGAAFTGVGLAITGALAGMAIKATLFNKAMGEIETLIPGSSARMSELKAAIQDMSIAVGKSTNDLAEGAYNVISAFGDTPETIALLETSAKAATAGVATTTEALNLLSAVTKAYGDTSKLAVSKVSDLAFQTVKLGQTTFPALAQSIGRVTPMAEALGITQEELFAVMATGTGVLGKASEVSTSFRGVLQALMAPTEETSKLFASLGIESGAALIQQKGLKGAIVTLTEAAKSTNTPLQKYIGSIDGINIATALAGSLSEQFDEKLAAMEVSAGATEEAFKAYTEGVNAAGFQMDRLKKAFGVVAEVMGESLSIALGDVAEGLADIIRDFAVFMREHPGIAKGVGTITAAFGLLSLAIGGILIGSTSLPAIGTAVKVLGNTIALVSKTTWAAALLPISPVIVGVAAISAALIALFGDWGELKAMFENFAIWMKTVFRSKMEAEQDESAARFKEIEAAKAWYAIEKKRELFHETIKLDLMKQAEELKIKMAAERAQKETVEAMKKALNTITPVSTAVRVRLEKDFASTKGMIMETADAITLEYADYLTEAEIATAASLKKQGLDWESYAEGIVSSDVAATDTEMGKLLKNYGATLTASEMKLAEELLYMGEDWESYVKRLGKEGDIGSGYVTKLTALFEDVSETGAEQLSLVGVKFGKDILTGNMSEAIGSLKGNFNSAFSHIAQDLTGKLAKGLMDWIGSGLKSIASAFWKGLSGGSGGFFESLGGALKSVLGGGTASAVSGGVSGGVGSAAGGAAVGATGIGGALGSAAVTAGISLAVGAALMGIMGLINKMPKHERRARDDAKDTYPAIARDIEADFKSGKISPQEAEFKVKILEAAIPKGQVLLTMPQSWAEAHGYKASDLAAHSASRHHAFMDWLDYKWKESGGPADVAALNAATVTKPVPSGVVKPVITSKTLTPKEPTQLQLQKQAAAEAKAAEADRIARQLRTEAREKKLAEEAAAQEAAEKASIATTVTGATEQVGASVVAMAPMLTGVQQTLKNTFDKKMLTLTPGSAQYKSLAATYNKILKAQVYHQGGMVPGRGDQLGILQGGEEVLSRRDPRNSNNFGGIVINVSGVMLDSEADARKLSKIVGDRVMTEIDSRLRYSR